MSLNKFSYALLALGLLIFSVFAATSSPYESSSDSFTNTSIFILPNGTAHWVINVTSSSSSSSELEGSLLATLDQNLTQAQLNGSFTGESSSSTDMRVAFTVESKKLSPTKQSATGKLTFSSGFASAVLNFASQEETQGDKQTTNFSADLDSTVVASYLSMAGWSEADVSLTSVRQGENQNFELTATLPKKVFADLVKSQCQSACEENCEAESGYNYTAYTDCEAQCAPGYEACQDNCSYDNDWSEYSDCLDECDSLKPSAYYNCSSACEDEHLNYSASLACSSECESQCPDVSDAELDAYLATISNNATLIAAVEESMTNLSKELENPSTALQGKGWAKPATPINAYIDVEQLSLTRSGDQVTLTLAFTWYKFTPLSTHLITQLDNTYAKQRAEKLGSEELSPPVLPTDSESAFNVLSGSYEESQRSQQLLLERLLLALGTTQEEIEHPYARLANARLENLRFNFRIQSGTPSLTLHGELSGVEQLPPERQSSCDYMHFFFTLENANGKTTLDFEGKLENITNLQSMVKRVTREFMVREFEFDNLKANLSMANSTGTLLLEFDVLNFSQKMNDSNGTYYRLGFNDFRSKDAKANFTVPNNSELTVYFPEGTNFLSTPTGTNLTGNKLVLKPGEYAPEQLEVKYQTSEFPWTLIALVGGGLLLILVVVGFWYFFMRD